MKKMLSTETIQLGQTVLIKPQWPAPSNIQAYTTTRKHGFSQKPFDQLNLSLNTDDASEAVLKNRQQIIEDLALPNPPFYLKQTHSTRCITTQMTNQNSDNDADASCTQQSSTVACVLTADCLPLLVCSRKGDEIAAIHAGWRGLLDGVVENTLAQLSSPKSELLIWLGPAISQLGFEVQNDVLDAFNHRHPLAEHAFIPSKNAGRFMGDLYYLARILLNAFGIHDQQIFGGDYCTYTQSDLFYSYRRDQNTSGRMASLIWMQ